MLGILHTCGHLGQKERGKVCGVAACCTPVANWGKEAAALCQDATEADKGWQPAGAACCKEGLYHAYCIMQQILSRGA